MEGRSRGAWCACTAALVSTYLLSFPAGALAQVAAVSFDRGRRDQPAVALTFDGGSDAGETALILDVLERRGVVATFFLTGRYISNNQDLVRRICAAGHEVGNHTWSHPHLTAWDATRRHTTLPGRDRRYLLDELERAAAAYLAVTGEPMTPLWRAPYGEVNGELLRWAAEAGWGHVGWTRDDAGGRHTLDSLDWVAEPSSRNYLSSEQIEARVLSFGGGGAGLNGGIVLMHLSTRRDDPGVERLGSLIDELRRGGHDLVTVSRLRRDAAPAAPAPLTAALSPAIR